MQQVIKITIFIAVLFLVSCESQMISKDLTIYGCRIGDSITADFKKVEQFGDYLSDYKLQKDKRVYVSTIKNYITTIRISNLTIDEVRNTVSLISEKLKKDPEKFNGQTHHGLKMQGIDLYWADSKSNTDYSLWTDLKSDTKHYLTIESQYIHDSIARIFIPDYDDLDIEIVEIPLEE